MGTITLYGQGTYTLELRDTSPNALAEIRGLIARYGGQVAGDGPDMNVRAPNQPKALELIRSTLEADPRVVSPEERAAAEHFERTAAHEAEQEAARKADREAQLQAQNAELQARIAELERN
jgi:hypothetical protein